MKVCAETLILVDNDGSVSEVNQKIIKSTLKYMLYHTPENRAYCISPYGHEVEDSEEFTLDINDLLCKVDLLEFAPKDSNLTDVLTKTLKDWREADFACRDILVFTDGLESTSINFEDEELFYMIKETSYPIYIVNLVQENNETVKKHLSAVATTSDGKLFLSEFPGDDGGVDKQLSDDIFKQMDLYAKREWAQYEEDEEETISESESEESGEKENNSLDDISDENSKKGEDEKEESLEKDEVSEEIDEEFETADLETAGGSVIYKNTSSSELIKKPTVFIGIIVAIILLIISGFVVSMYFVKKRKKSQEETEEIKEMASENTTKEDFFGEKEKVCDPFETLEETKTRLLMPMEEDEGQTRLLSNSKKIIILEDEENIYKRHELFIDNPIIVGRGVSLCDYVLEGDFVSKKHCEFGYSNGSYYVRDLNSSNGTFVNDKKISQATLNNGDKITIGKAVYTVKLSND